MCVRGHFIPSCTKLKLWAEVSMFPLLSSLMTSSCVPFYHTEIDSFMYCCDLSVNPNWSQNNYQENEENDIQHVQLLVRKQVCSMFSDFWRVINVTWNTDNIYSDIKPEQNVLTKNFIFKLTYTVSFSANFPPPPLYFCETALLPLWFKTPQLFSWVKNYCNNHLVRNRRRWKAHC